MKLLKNKYLNLIFIVSMCLFFLISGIVCPTSVQAETASTYTSVMDDLKKDKNFNVEDYPAMTLAYYKEINSDLSMLNDQESMEIIQIAESNKGELFLYVYQPTDSQLNLTANSILMSCEYTSDGNNIQGLEIYYLELISTSTVFDKYKVKNFTVSTDEYRYYNIVTLYRDYTPAIDTIAGGTEEEGNEKGVKVAQQWCVYSENGNVVYEKGLFKTVEVKITFTGSIRLENGIQFLPNFGGNFKECDAWFVVFNVEDYIVSRIYDADLVYRKRHTYDYTFNPTGNEGIVPQEEWSEDIKITLKETDTVTFEGEGWFAKDYKWNRICRASDFLLNFEKQEADLEDNVKEELKLGQWVFAFLETDYYFRNYNTIQYHDYTDISKVTVIRMHFLDILGREYNLGVVSDRVNPDSIPDGKGGGFNYLKIQQILAIICLLILLFILQTTGILPLLGKLFIWIISLPFKFLKWLIDKFRGD